ncbi:MAG: hypothetical protein A2898_03120 [Candidatus Kerfeldbacteria bacterium RIFCSPLOWO2_01_FULL_48_11]|uniref:DUF4367 domain-containing protein n=1 Tax=Candidatus Kerfeldbacteria bacterium RIFCSPLOWO2_01_FULL_48_11 TaxID=1798543 RepID=A0A1G2B529_9BACT|nr:MAG: hypothetical protein UY34_C0027G0009 [Parcubacteria group bacterium GW2011_GWA2_48_9]OGY84293.1 MAG: hypothetical protein A2898_03120 [Candidatus Kerfeldbacteria bacterium RIFCSPLOWO2_01_FULL_48_11]HCM68010.1 hypothetical protein [Candidatus Kerfeldbacteria bacterium]
MNKKYVLAISAGLVILLVALGASFWYRNETTDSKNANTINSSNEKEFNSQELGVGFRYPSSYVLYSETSNLPESNLANIYIDSENREYTVSINLYDFPNSVSIDDFIIEQKENNNILLPELVSGESLDPFVRSERVLNGKSFVIFTSKQTGDRSYFLSEQGHLVMIQEQGVRDDRETVLDAVASSFEFK